MSILKYGKKLCTVVQLLNYIDNCFLNTSHTAHNLGFDEHFSVIKLWLV